MYMEKNRESFVPGEKFQDVKGRKYQFVTCAVQVVTREKLMVFQSLFGDFAVMALPLDKFLSFAGKLPEKKAEPETKESAPHVTAAAGEETEQEVCDQEPNRENDVEEKRETEEIPEGMNPFLHAFLEASEAAQRLELFNEPELVAQIDDKCVDDMAAVLDVAIGEGDLEERIRQLRSCLETVSRFEIPRR